MAVTRDKALRLLNKSEMVLFGDSRNPALRALSASELARRVDRARALRDKSRDLLQRQSLGSRARTGSKSGALGDANERTRRKGEVLEDILQRFEDRLGDVARDEAVTAKAPAKTSSVRKSTDAGKKATGRHAATSRKTAGTPVKAAKSKATGKPASAGKPAATGTSAAATAKNIRPITPRRALANTRQLLAEKQSRDLAPKAYRVLDTGATDQRRAEFQSDAAAGKALELHAGESRMDAIHGSVSTHDRHNQGKRDSR